MFCNSFRAKNRLIKSTLIVAAAGSSFLACYDTHLGADRCGANMAQIRQSTRLWPLLPGKSPENFQVSPSSLESRSGESVRWSATLSSKVNLPHAINFRTNQLENLTPEPEPHLFGALLVTLPRVSVGAKPSRERERERGCVRERVSERERE